MPKTRQGTLSVPMIGWNMNRTKKRYVKLSGVTIGETYYDPQTNTYGSICYALRARSLKGVEGSSGFISVDAAMTDVIRLNDEFSGPRSDVQLVTLCKEDRQLLHELLTTSAMNCKDLLAKQRQTKQAREFAQKRLDEIKRTRQALRKFE